MNSLASKSLVLPAKGKQPTFDEVANIVLLSTFCNLSVCVMCLTQETLEHWMDWLNRSSSASVTLLDVLNTNCATLTDWKALLSSQSYDITVLSGAGAELQTNRLSVGYVKALVRAVPAGLVVVA